MTRAELREIEKTSYDYRIREVLCRETHGYFTQEWSVSRTVKGSLLGLLASQEDIATCISSPTPSSV